MTGTAPRKQPSDPQTYYDDNGKLRRKPGRPRKNPLMTQREIKAAVVADRRQKLKEATPEPEVNHRTQMKDLATGYLTATPDLMDVLIHITDLIYRGVLPEGTSPSFVDMAKMRQAASESMAAALMDITSPERVIAWMSARHTELEKQLAAQASAAPSEPADPGIDPDLAALMAQGLPGDTADDI